MRNLLCFLFLGLLFFGCSRGISLYPDKSVYIKYQDTSWARGRYFERIDTFKSQPIGSEKIVFLGNSIVKGGGNWNTRFNTLNIVNRGISGDITEGILKRLDEIIFYKPVAVFLLAGFNDFFYRNGNDAISPKYVYNNIILIAENIKLSSPETKIYLQTIMPFNNHEYIRTTASYPFLEDKYKPSINEQIKDVNMLIRANNNFNVIDIYPYFINDEGLLKKTLSDDGLHPNENGYAIWVDILRPYIADLKN